MSVHKPIEHARGLAVAATIRPLDVDLGADIRALHAASFKTFSGDAVSDPECLAAIAAIRSPGYVESVLEKDAIGIWIGSDLVTTASWTPASDYGDVARIGDLYVHPLYGHAGLGTLALAEIERCAQMGGFTRFAVSVVETSVGFFERHGYSVSGHGTRLHGTVAIPVTHLRKTLPANLLVAHETADAA
jgi:GNAT superfamily N-acetyltransferase